jgi:hypothetical protein
MNTLPGTIKGMIMEIEIKKVSLSDIKLNPDNPRQISDKDMDRLIKSLQEFPDMMGIREIVCDENFVVIGGNMRLLALRKIGAKEVTAKIVSGLTEAQKREFIIKDNGAWGEWDMDALSSAWSDLPLIDWGVNIPVDWTEGVLDLSGGDGENKQTTYDKLADKKGGVLFNFGDIQQSIPIEIYEYFKSKINTEKVKESLIKELSK